MSNHSASLAYELAELEDAVRAARLVVEMIATNAVPKPGEEQRVAVAAAAALHLVEARVRLVARVVRGDAQVATLAADHNRVADAEDSDDAEDVILRDRANQKSWKRGR